MAEKKHNALGKGLNSIFGSDVEQFLDDIQNNAQDVPGRRELEIPVEEIRPNPYQPRKEFEPKALNELAESIRQHGIFTPLLVRKSVSGYDLITGERRLRAAKLAKLKTVPAISVEFTDEQMMEISLLENIQRENLNPIEEAAAYESLVKRLGYTQEKLAERVGKSREYCANMLRLLKLPQDVQEMVTEKQLTMGHVRPLLALKDEDEMYDAAQYIIEHKLSVREVEAYIRELNGNEKKPAKTKTEKAKDPMILDIEHRMSEKLGTEVELKSKKISISYHDTDDLNRILEALGCIEASESEK
ncbi:MAG: ParB/RepB/Spo0J family partition protein [Solobacterium sp.]|jgi:ParB family chromosome partitioning protein|nr:ParB/RepB/Spo0J family partition protein [Solobacterium sp.]MCH4265818.1 ParB/RepB/Spo0J family partition protein [Solobacterium sp.]